MMVGLSVIAANAGITAVAAIASITAVAGIAGIRANAGIAGHIFRRFSGPFTITITKMTTTAVC